MGDPVVYGASVLPHDEIVRLYGPWLTRTPQDAARLLDRYRGRWWIAGGWAIQAFTAVARPHGDLDIGIPRSAAAALHRHVSGRLDVWQATKGALRPMIDPEDDLPQACGNLWLRPNGAAPWEFDVLLTTTRCELWMYKRDARICLPVAEIVWTHEGISYLRPEVQLLHKAPGLRPQDQADFDACLPLLDPGRRGWLRIALSTAHPGHPWIEQL